MRKFTTIAAAAIASLALLGGAATAIAQDGTAQRERTIDVPPGALVIVLPGAAMPGTAWRGSALDTGFPVAAPPVAAMQSPWALMRQVDEQMDRMMQAAQSGFALPDMTDVQHVIEASAGRLPQDIGMASGVTVTSFSDGHGTCTQRITYPGNGAAPKVEVSDTGNACGGLHVPALTRPHSVSGARILQAHYVRPATHTPARPVQLAQLGD